MTLFKRSKRAPKHLKLHMNLIVKKLSDEGVYKKQKPRQESGVDLFINAVILTLKITNRYALIYVYQVRIFQLS